MSDENWTQVAGEAMDRLAPYGPVILMGLEAVRRQLGRNVERKEFIGAKSVYALLKTSFERDPENDGRQMLENFVKEPDRYREQIIALVAQKASNRTHDFGHKLIALTNRWRENKRPLPPAAE